MNHMNNHQAPETPRYSLKDFTPLISIIGIIVLLTIIKQSVYGFSIHSAMYDLMGFFFVVFSAFKIINLPGFVEAYSTYDIITKRYITWGYIYPFIELSLGLAYLTRYQLTAANLITVVLMIIGSIGVAQELAQKKSITCACLGAVFKIPMTYVTLAEDIIMGVMALVMLFL